MTSFHIRPRRGWLNDPNGVTHHDGRWHVFFQHNPEAPVHDRIHWGHVSSPDLVTWREHPVAFGPQPDGPDTLGCWSGVFVPGLDRPAVVYSGLVDEAETTTVCLRHGSDDLDTWSEPVVVAAVPDGVGVRVMRDPFLFEHGGRRWATVGAGLDDGTPALLLYAVDDMLRWRFGGVWLTGHDGILADAAAARVWECPQLVVVDGVAVLVLSLWDGDTTDVVAVTGTLDVYDDRPRFRPERVEALGLDDAFYAPQLVEDGDAPLLFGWVREDAKPGRPSEIAGCLTLPRRLSVDHGRVVSTLDPAVEALTPGAGRPRTAGRHDVSGAVRLGIPTASRGVRLAAVDGGVDVALSPGADVWVDDDVVEVLHGDGARPLTLRGSSARWVLTVPPGAEVCVRDVVLPSP